ncbi:MAG: zf-HC2 domain-containing protein [Candidatus Omnitrophota bacterium]
MQDRFESLVKLVYKKWKSGLGKVEGVHPDEEAIACFLEGRLSKEENDHLKAHLLSCDDCAQSVVLGLGMKTVDKKEVPGELLDKIKGSLFTAECGAPILEILLRAKGKLLEILNTTGDVLVGRELVPAPLLRGRLIKDFKEGVTILKDLQNIKVEAKIENKGEGAFILMVVVKEKQTQNIVKDLRVTLLKDDLELESYLTDTGSVTFGHILLGNYRIEVSVFENKLASILLDISN